MAQKQEADDGRKVVKRSIAMTRELWAKIEDAAEDRGVSLSHVCREKLGKAFQIPKGRWHGLGKR